MHRTPSPLSRPRAALLAAAGLFALATLAAAPLLAAPPLGAPAKPFAAKPQAAPAPAPTAVAPAAKAAPAPVAAPAAPAPAAKEAAPAPAAAPAAAAPAAKKADAAVEEVEEEEAPPSKPGAPAPAAAATKEKDHDGDKGKDKDDDDDAKGGDHDKKGTPSLLEYLGHTHIAVVHQPIAWLLLLMLIDLIAFLPLGFLGEEGRKHWRNVGLFLGVLTVLAIASGIGTGLIFYKFEEDDPHLVNHRNMAYIAGGLFLVAFLFRWFTRETLHESGKKWIYLGLVFASLFVIAWAAHIGGAVSRGAEFLPF